LIADQYTEHVANATVARYAPSGYYIASGGKKSLIEKIKQQKKSF